MYETRPAYSCAFQGTGQGDDPRSRSSTAATTSSTGHPLSVQISVHETDAVAPASITLPGVFVVVVVGQSIPMGRPSVSSHSYPSPSPGSTITQMLACTGEPGGGGAQRASAMTSVPATSEVTNSRFTEGGSYRRWRVPPGTST